MAKRLSITSGLLLLALALGACASQAPAGGVAGARPVEVQAVSVEVGVGSPIPVDVVVAGQWPDACSQLVQINQAIEGTDISIEILGAPAETDCPPDFVGLALRIAVPLNAAALEAGTYNVTVNGVSASFQWDN